MVEQRSGKSIPQLFEEGEDVFRKLEREAVERALAMPACVIALGGGAFSQPGAAELLLEKALVVHLYTPWSVISRCLADLARGRPLVRVRAAWQVHDLFLARAASYLLAFFFFSSRRRHTRCYRDWSSDVCSSD